MGGKTSVTLFNCLLGSALILGGSALANRIGDRDPLLALGVLAAALIFPLLIVSRVAWAAGYEAGRRVRDPDPPAPS